jgi:hypothetical protein
MFVEFSCLFYFQNWELLVLSKLEWNISAITGFDYIDHILERVPWGAENPHIRQHAHTLVSVCCTGKFEFETHQLTMSVELSLSH